jgi:SAM-dependent methyltransferase
MSDIKNALKKVVPAPLATALRKYRARDPFPEYKALSTKEAFTKIYEEGVWGKSHDPARKYFSGSGSHDEQVVALYVQAISLFLQSMKAKPSVVDLGCGDFNVGSQVRHLCQRYTACDIVEPLIEFNKTKYNDLEVDFKVLDLATDALPPADVVFVRQVLQHLSNDMIQRALPKIGANYKYLVLSEHLPSSTKFKPNIDKPSGPDNRLSLLSGVVLTAEPFNLTVMQSQVLCEVHEAGGVIVTTCYQLNR